MATNTFCEVAQGFRLSPQQQRVWHLQKTQANSILGVQACVSVHGFLDTKCLSAAIKRVRERHEILRTSFGFLQGTLIPVQIVNESPEGLDDVVDLRGGSAWQQESAVQNFARKEWDRLRELQQAPALTCVLIVLSDYEHCFVLTASPLCADADSLINVIAEIQADYLGKTEEYRQVQYADLAEWQNQLLEGAADEDHTPYWGSREFSDSSSVRLPFALNREDAAGGFTTSAVHRVVPAEIAIALDGLAKGLGLSVDVILLATWEIVLSRFSGMDRFLIGIAPGSLPQAQLENAIGPLLKFLPLSAKLDGNPRFTRLIEDLQTTFKAAEYDQLLFDPESFGAAHPQARYLFPLLFTARREATTQSAGRDSWKIESLVERLEPFELGLTAVSGPQSCKLEFAFSDSVFTQADVELLANCYTAVLKQIVENAGRHLNEFVLTGPGIPLSITAGAVAEDTPWTNIVEAIENQARRCPEQPAVVCEEERISYAELDRRASALAGRLEHAIPAPDAVIALIARRSVGFIVGVFAILKAGAAWLPIEPDIPPGRIKYMLQQARAVAIVTQSELGELLNHPGLPIFYTEENSTDITPRHSVYPVINQQQLAYVIFTSGSTGQPKGVAIEHRQLAAYVRGLAAKADLNHGLDAALVSTPAADLGHTAVFASLASGGCLHVISAARALDAHALGEYFVEHHIDLVKIVPSHLEALCRSLPKTAKFHWRYMFIGGEPLAWNLVESIQQFAPQCTVLNHYGPTETTVGVFCGPAEIESETFRRSHVPIGTPFAGTTAYVLDEQLQPVPQWVSGELYIGGASVGRGYLGHAEITAERFIPDPFHPVAGSRMYGTGDFVRYRSDGKMEFLGRRDGQVKIRGYRVELGEVEAALCRHPDVHNAVVVSSDDPAAGKHLLAWVAVGAAKVTAEELRSFLEKSLPGHMVPGILMCVDRLKLTPNGKVDRQALPTAVLPTAPEFLEPLDEIEEKLVAVWRKVLALGRISVGDNYFALGGDSLRVIQLVHEARCYGIAISANDVLRHQNIRKLRKELRQRSREDLFPDGIPQSAAPLSSYVPSLSTGVLDCYPISGIQRYMLEKYVANKGDQAIYHIQDCVRLRDATFSIEALVKAIQAVVERHPALRTVFDLRGVPAMQLVLLDSRWSLPVINISDLEPHAQESHISAALLAERAALFNCNDLQTPLFRFAVFLRSPCEFNLMFSCHHAIMDGWGHRVLHNQLIDAYMNIKSGVAPRLGEPDKTYREFVAFQDAVCRSEKAAMFWQRYLADIEDCKFPPCAVDGDQPHDPQIIRMLGPDLTEQLISVARNHTFSMQALLLSVWLQVLREESDREIAVCGVVANGRSEYLTDPLSAIGLFWNIVPVVSRKTSPLLEQAGFVQRDLIEIEPYSAYPLPKLLADFDHRELFYSVFRYLNFWNAKSVPEDSGLQIIDMQSHDRYSFALTCSALIGARNDAGFLQIQYDPDIVTKDHAQFLLDRYETLLYELAAHPKQ